MLIDDLWAISMKIFKIRGLFAVFENFAIEFLHFNFCK